jgi:hypothetical protein
MEWMYSVSEKDSNLGWMMESNDLHAWHLTIHTLEVNAHADITNKCSD